ncbi:hypothetical protein SANTM175S_09405 [Streptomyces antimycoticus]
MEAVRSGDELAVQRVCCAVGVLVVDSGVFSVDVRKGYVEGLVAEVAASGQEGVGEVTDEDVLGVNIPLSSSCSMSIGRA